MTDRRTDPRFVIDDVEPAYLALARSGELADRAEAGVAELAPCRVCPRDCDVDRLTDEIGACRTGHLAVVASAIPHHGEEDCLRGRNGSGTIFFGGCSLRCVFCQNWKTSQRAVAPESTAAEIADLMVRLQASGCHIVNLVMPGHVVPQVLEAVAVAVPRGLRLPLVHNASGYDALRSLELLDGVVDIYMPDVKFWAPATRLRPARIEHFLTLLPRDTGEAATMARGHDHRVAQAGYGPGMRRRLRHVLELRHPENLCEEVATIARRHGVALAVSDAAVWPRVEEVTAGFVYVRLHGPAELYASAYGDDALGRWAGRLRRWNTGGEPNDTLRLTARKPPRRLGRDVYAYFDDTAGGHAVRDATILRRLVEP